MIADTLKRRLSDYKTRQNRRRVIILDDVRAAYLPIAKVASSSLRIQICQRQAALFYPGDMGLAPNSLKRRMEKRIRKSLRTDELRQLAKTHYVFAFVRNPIARLYSCYLDKVVKTARMGKDCSLSPYGISDDMTLDEFVHCIAEIPDAQSDQHFRSQHLFVREGETWLTHYLGRFERLNEDWEHIRANARMEDLDLPVWRQTGAGSDLDQIPFSRATAKRAVDRYREDIELLGYEKEVAAWLRTCA